MTPCAGLEAQSVTVPSSLKALQLQVPLLHGPSLAVSDRLAPRTSLTLLNTSISTDLNGVLGNYATLGLNIADFSRYADKPSAQNVQAIVIPFIFSESTFDIQS